MNGKTLAAAAAVLATGAAGCWQMPQSKDPAPPPQDPPKVRPDYIQKAAVDYGADPDAQGENAVESALVWSEKYSRAMERVIRLQNECRDLEERNKKLLEQVSGLQTELSQARKELADANDLVLEMRRDLDQWKSNVLSFRAEMRSAQQAELEALSKVIRLLGGEVVQPTTRPAPQEAANENSETKSPGA